MSHLIRVAGFDPGESTGWAVALFDTETKKGTLQTFGVFDKENVMSEMQSVQADVFVVEGYKIRPAKITKGYAHQWNDGFTLQVIGGLKMIADIRGLVYKEQQPSVKPSAYGFLGKEYRKGKKGMHHMDAVAHLLYYLIKEKGGAPDCLNLSMPRGL